jgi:hypothetical protein
MSLFMASRSTTTTRHLHLDDHVAAVEGVLVDSLDPPDLDHPRPRPSTRTPDRAPTPERHPAVHLDVVVEPDAREIQEDGNPPTATATRPHSMSMDEP